MDNSCFSFRFRRSFEDHNTRHSWILGFWCHICFETICTHIIQTGSECIKCITCTNKENARRAYLRTRGLHRGQKMGAIKVFYNQCQFIEHMKMHRLSSVNMGDLMLMPLPINMSNNNWSSEFEVLCEALMERAFLLRIHIIDWLKMHNLQDNWWKLVNDKSNDNMINKIVDSYQGRQLFETYDQLTANMSINFSSSNVSKNSPDVEFIDNSSMENTNSYSANIISDKNSLENEDNPCTSTDITFIDCGPTSQHFEPEISMNYTHKKQVTIPETKNCHLANTARMNSKTKNEAFEDHNLYETDMIHENASAIKAGDNGSNKNLIESSKDYVQQYKTVQSFVEKIVENNSSKTGINKISNNSVKIGIPFSVKKSVIAKTNLDHSEQSLQPSRANSKVLTIQDPKSIASIVRQLPHFNKKIVIIGQDSYNIVAHNENEVAKKDSSISIIDHSNTDSNVKKEEITGKVIIRNGKKYLIKGTKNITKDLRSSSNLSIMKNVTKQPIFEYNTSKSTSSNHNESVVMEQTASLYNNVSSLTPSPSPPELSSNSSCESNIKKTSIMPKLQKVPSHLISMSAIHSAQKYIRNVFETISLIKEENGDLYMDIKVVDRIAKESFRDVCDVIVKYRREMFDEFYQMNSLELKERIDHLQCVTEEMEQVLNFISDTVFKEKLRAVNTLQCILEECFNKYNRDIQDKKSSDVKDVILNEWETKVDPIYRCPLCNRFMKPESYVAGFSKLPKNDNAYCSCYKQVCHICSSYQGTVSRFIAHQNFHRKSYPYVCPDCDSKFDSATSLEVHTWTVCFHTMRNLIFNCKICEIDGFRDLESITRHFVIMHSKTKVGCEDCLRVFFSHNEYVQHCAETHPSKIKQNPIRLVICKLSNVILRCENYMSYLRKYPGIRKLVWLKCPFCHLITTDNKHVGTLMNTHIRNYHVESLSEIISNEAFTEIFGTEFLKTEKGVMRRKIISFQSNEKTFANDVPTRFPTMSCLDDTMVPKIVNTRTISSEIFEHGSQDTEYLLTWSDTNEIESLQTMKKIDDKERRELLPKIINVRSISDLKPSKAKEAITKFSIKTKKKSNSPSLQVIIETEDGKVDPFAHKESAMELDDNKSNSSEKTTKTKKFDKDSSELNASCVSESEKSLLDTVNVNSPIVSSKKVSNSTSEGNTDSLIKIVDFKKICKPDIQQFVTVEMPDSQIKDENASYITSMPKPPPLVKIPQHLLEPVEISEAENEPANGSKKSKSKKSFVRRVTNKSKVRIALGTDVQKEKGIDYLCHLCNERINTSYFVIQRHFREKHSDEYRIAVITPQLSRMSPDFINGGYKQFINNKKRKSDNALFTSKRKRRWTPKKHVEMKDANPPVGLCVEQETAEDGEGNFICKKCGQRCTDMSDLREHIAASHRLKGRYLICLECGENFVVAPSLQMHLKAFHGIEDPINYMNQNPSYAPDDSDLQTEGRTTVANQCYVCMAVFEDKAAVDKHLRVHGMAFLNHKRIEARNALEKKTEEDRSSIIKNEASKETAKRDKPAETILEKINVCIN